jgi:hypothetical protein
MPVSPFEGDFDHRAAAEGRPEPRHDPVQPEVRVSAREDHEEPGTEVTLEEPGYGHGV